MILNSIREGKRPKHEIIEEDLLEKIQSGFYPEFSILPKELELAEIYGVSRPTVRQALQKLSMLGCVDRIKKKGTVVKKKKINQDFTNTIQSFDSEMLNKGLRPKTVVMSFKEDTAGEDAAKNLNIPVGACVYKLVRLRYADDLPVVLVTTWLPKELLPGFLSNNFVNNTLYSTLHKLGHDIKMTKRVLEIIKCDEVTGDLLGIKEGEPLFLFKTRAYTFDNTIIEYSVSRYRSDINSFEFVILNQRN